MARKEMTRYEGNKAIA